MNIFEGKIYQKTNSHSFLNNLPNNIQDGDLFIRCVFNNNKKSVKIFTGIKDIILAGCIFKNCSVPNNAKIALHMKNCHRKLPKGIKDNDIIVESNLHQRHPDTKVCKGIKGLRVIKSNCMNCVFPPGTIVEDCLTVQKEIVEIIES